MPVPSSVTSGPRLPSVATCAEIISGENRAAATATAPQNFDFLLRIKDQFPQNPECVKYLVGCQSFSDFACRLVTEALVQFLFELRRRQFGAATGVFRLSAS